MSKRCCVSRHTANRAAGVLEEDHRLAVRVWLETVDNIVHQRIRKFVDKPGFQIFTLIARVAVIPAFLYGDIVDRRDSVGDGRTQLS